MSQSNVTYIEAAAGLTGCSFSIYSVYPSKLFSMHSHTHISTFVPATQIFLRMDIFPHPPTPLLKSSCVGSHYTDASQLTTNTC